MLLCLMFQNGERLTEEEIDQKLFASEEDLQAGRLFSQELLDSRMKEKLRYEGDISNH